MTHGAQINIKFHNTANNESGSCIFYYSYNRVPSMATVCNNNPDFKIIGHYSRVAGDNSPHNHLLTLAKNEKFTNEPFSQFRVKLKSPARSSLKIISVNFIPYFDNPYRGRIKGGFPIDCRYDNKKSYLCDLNAVTMVGAEVNLSVLNIQTNIQESCTINYGTSQDNLVCSNNPAFKIIANKVYNTEVVGITRIDRILKLSKT